MFYKGQFFFLSSAACFSIILLTCLVESTGGLRSQYFSDLHRRSFTKESSVPSVFEADRGSNAKVTDLVYRDDSHNQPKPRRTETQQNILGEASKSTYSGGNSFLELRAGSGVGGGLGSCKTCVYVLERIKQGYQYQLPAICTEVFKGGLTGASTSPTLAEDFGACHEVLAGLSVWGQNVKNWFHAGCYKSEAYGAMELIKPCPSHVICSQMTSLKQIPFCKAPKPDNLQNGE